MFGYYVIQLSPTSKKIKYLRLYIKKFSGIYICVSGSTNSFLDNAYFDEGADNVLIPTAWIPLIDANMTNGCMVVCFSYLSLHQTLSLYFCFNRMVTPLLIFSCIMNFLLK